MNVTNINKFFIVFVAVHLFIPSTIFALPFNVGEELEFSLSWMGIPAGTTTLGVKEIVMASDTDAFHIVSRSWSNKFVSTFYKVEDRVDGYMATEDLSSMMLKVKQREGRHKNDKKLVFDHQNHKVEYTKNGRKSIHEVPPLVHDSFSAFYFLRTHDLVPGNDIKINTFTNRKLYQVIIKVLGKEKIDVQAGTFNTIKVQPLIKHNDVFKNEGKIFIWLTDDEYKIPVMIKVKIKIGHIRARLTKLKRGGDDGDR